MVRRREFVAYASGLFPLLCTWEGWGITVHAEPDVREVTTLDKLIDRIVGVELIDETYLADVTLTDLVREDGEVSELVVRENTTTRRLAAKEVAEVYLDGEPCDVALSLNQRGLEISQKKRKERLRRDAEASSRLTERKQKLWPRQTKALYQQAMKEHEAHLEQVRKLFPARSFEVEQSRYYILCSDLDPAESRQILTSLDRLYDALCDGFGIPIGMNVWHGKCIVHAFRERADFLAWEEHYYKNGTTTSGARVHWNLGTGRVIITLSPQRSLSGKLGLLVHETTFGLIHRYRSSMPVPKWMRVGISEWASETVVPEFEGPSARRDVAIATCKRSKTISFDFLVDEGVVEGDAGVGLASALVRFLHEKDKRKYRQYCLAIKDGRFAEESLKLAYGWDYDALINAFGKSIGVSKLRRVAR